MYYWSMFGYGLRSLSQNEFYAAKYTSYVPCPNATATGSMLTPNSTAVRAANCGNFWNGGLLLNELSLSTDPQWKWGGIAFLAGFFFLVNAMSGLGLSSVYIERNIGSSRLEEKEADDGVVVVDDTPLSSAASVMPFEPMTVTWSDIEYTVQLNKNLGGGSKCLLQQVSGVALPGRMMALMGASGAGKTTLLDVIAGRKNSGKMSGAISLNGHPKEAKSFARLTAYCEQIDVHNTFATVVESLRFSASLRLPASVDEAKREAFVQEVLDLLELRPIASRKVGDIGSAEGLSPGQRKILTIAVEMVSNAPILFLDEPTSGLDSRAAQVVIREVRKIATTGRTVICTIHQPSKELFFQFDDMCLLQRGGWQVYLGPVGARASALVQFVESIPGAHACPKSMNPASWMLDVLAGTDSSGLEEGARPPAPAAAAGKVVGPEDEAAAPEGEAHAKAMASSTFLDGPMLQRHLKASAPWAAHVALLAAHSQPPEGSKPFTFDSVYARPFWYQLLACLERVARSYHRVRPPPHQGAPASPHRLKAAVPALALHRTCTTTSRASP